MVAKQGKSKDFKRKITHKEYTFMSEAAKKVGIINKLNKEITHDVKKITKEAIAIEKKQHSTDINDKYMEYPVAKYVMPFILGGVCLFLAVSFTYVNTSPNYQEPASLTSWIFIFLFFS